MRTLRALDTLERSAMDVWRGFALASGALVRLWRLGTSVQRVARHLRAGAIEKSAL